MLRGITDTHFKTLPSNKTEVKNKREKKNLAVGERPGMEHIPPLCTLSIKYANEFNGFVLSHTLEYLQVKISASKCGFYSLSRVLYLKEFFSYLWSSPSVFKFFERY